MQRGRGMDGASLMVSRPVNDRGRKTLSSPTIFTAISSAAPTEHDGSIVTVFGILAGYLDFSDNTFAAAAVTSSIGHLIPSILQ